MALLLQILSLILIALIGSFVRQYRKRKKQPPGPLGIPFFGDTPIHVLLYLFPKMFPVISPNKYFLDMKKQYGKIWSSDLGDKKLVVLASIDLINEAFVDYGKNFQIRSSAILKLITEKHGIIFNAGEIWNANRQLAVKSLRDLGMGKRQLETQINEEILEMMETIERTSSNCFTCPKIFIKPISNVTYRLIFNLRNNDADPEFAGFIKNIDKMFNIKEAAIVEFIPKSFPMKYFRNIVPEVHNFVKSKDSCLKFIKKLCRDRIKIESEFSKPNCVFDYFWRFRYQDYPDVEYDERLTDITHSMFDLIGAGVDTTVNVLSFSCLLLGKYRDVQEDLRKEIQVLIDDYKLINMEMKKNCPKYISFVDEVHRFCCLVPRIFRQVVTNCMFQNYEITTDDLIYADLNTVFRDPTLFQYPNSFDAYRFLDKSRTKYTPNKNLIPFGLGKRACLGESIGVMTLFLFLSRIICRYDISLPKETEDNFSKIIGGDFGHVHSPMKHELIFTIYRQQ